MEKEFYLRDQKIGYSEKGQGPAIVMVHGWTSEDYNSELVDLLVSRGYHVVSPHLPEFRGSQLPKGGWSRDDYVNCVLKLVKLLNIEKFFLFGHSWGSTTAIKLAANCPEKIQALFLCAPEVLGTGFRAKAKKLARHRKRFRLLFFGYMVFALLSGNIDMFNICRKTKGAAFELLRLMTADDMVPLLEKIRGQTLVIWGDKDDKVSFKNAKFVADKIPYAAFKVIKGGIHEIEGEFAKKVGNSIIEFLNEVKID